MPPAPQKKTQTAPKGTAHRAGKHARTTPTQKTSSRPAISLEDLVDVHEKCRKKWGWEAELKPGQVEAIKAQLLGRDVVVHAATGYGKTCIAAGPHAHPKAAGSVTIMVSPLIGLQEEMVETFRSEFKLNAIAVNSSHGGCTIEALDNIVDGKYQIILISPELLLSNRFLDRIMRNTTFTRKILSVVIDEAHVVSHWGSQFRKQYGYLGLIRSFLPREASVVAMSATLSGRIRRDVLDKLYFGNDYLNIDVGNDRPNVSIVVRTIHLPMNSYHDLDFVVPTTTIVDPISIPLTWIYADSINTGIEIEDHLTELLPVSLQGAGIIRPYNAAYSKEYRSEVMRLVRQGSVRVLVCTDAAGMGCNIPDIDVVVQWKLPSSISSFLQRAGRAARQWGRQGLAVLLVEPSAYETDLFAEPEVSEPVQKGKTKKKAKKDATRTKAEIKTYAALRGMLRGSSERKDELLSNDQPPIDATAADEGLLALVQTTLCRRLVLKEIYKNTNETSCTGPCCDICNPELLDRTRPGNFLAPPRRSAVTKGIPSVTVQEKLNEWRTNVKKRDFPHALWSAEGLLRRETMVALSSVGPIRTRAQLEKVLAGQWKWSDRYGDELLQLLTSIEMPPYVPKLRKAAAKRKGVDLGEHADGGVESAPKRPRTEVEGGSRSASLVTLPSLTRPTSMPPVHPRTTSPSTPLRRHPPHPQYTPAPHPYGPYATYAQNPGTYQFATPWYNYSQFGSSYTSSPASSLSPAAPTSFSPAPSTSATPAPSTSATSGAGSSIPNFNPYRAWLSPKPPIHPSPTSKQ